MNFSDITPNDCMDGGTRPAAIPDAAISISGVKLDTEAHQNTNSEFIDELDGACSPVMSFARSPITSKASVSSETRIAEAVTRSLADQMPFANSEIDVAYGQRGVTVWSENERTKALSPLDSITRVLDWQDREGDLYLSEQQPGEGNLEMGNIDTITMDEKSDRDRPSPFEGMIDCKEKKASQKVPESSILAFGGNTQQNLKEKNKGRKEGDPQELRVTRTVDADRETVVVSAIPRKRKGRKNQHSYYDITPELRYLR